MKIVIFHGIYTKVTEHWFQSFKASIDTDDVEVLLPQFPLDNWNEIEKVGEEKVNSLTDTKQTLENWTKYFERNVLPSLKGEELIFIGHSAGPLFILHLLEKYDLKLKGAIFISPYLSKIMGGRWQMNFGNSTFVSENFNFDKIIPKLGQAYVLYSKSDPYIPSNYSLEFAKKTSSTIIPVLEGDHLGSTFEKLPIAEELTKSIVGFGKYYNERYILEYKNLNIFIDENGDFGNEVRIIIDESHSFSPAQRQDYATKSTLSEVVYINSIEKCNISIFCPTGEIPFAGPAVLGAVWYLNRLKGERITSLFSMVTTIAVRYNKDEAYVKANIATLPPWNLKELNSAKEIDAIKIEDTADFEHCLVWAWIDKKKGTIRARTFAPDWLIPEDDANGSGSMVLSSKLKQSITVYHGKGSVIYANYIDADYVEVGGDLSEERLKKNMYTHDLYSSKK